ncbi:MAG: DUF222 domain-containing protein [Actinomycetota bacterium]
MFGLIGWAEEREAVELRFTSALLDWWRERGWEADGSRSPAAWLRWRCGIDEADARRVLRRVRLLDAVAEVADVAAGGTIRLAHLDALASTVTPERVELARRDGSVLLAEAKELDLADYRRFLAHWRSLADDELATSDAVERHQRRYLRLSSTLFGEYDLVGRLDAEGGARVAAALAAATVPDVEGETRSAAQRRADALVALAEGSDSSGRTVPAMVVSVDVLGEAAPDPSSTAELDGVALARETVRRVGCDAAVARVVTAGRSEVVDVGRSTRVISPALRRALAVRDGGCRFPGCDVVHDRCDAHHLRHWAAGGATDLANLTLLCSFHHRLAHEGGWSIRAGPTPGDRVRAIRPDGSELPP